MNDRFTCPVCKKGKMLHSGLGWICSYFKTQDNKCDFIIYKSYFEHKITTEELKALCEKGETEILTDLKKKDKTVFSATLKVDKDKTAVVPAFDKLSAHFRQ